MLTRFETDLLIELTLYMLLERVEEQKAIIIIRGDNTEVMFSSTNSLSAVNHQQK